MIEVRLMGLADATSCESWDVRALLNHIVAGNLWAAVSACAEILAPRLDMLQGSGMFGAASGVGATGDVQTVLLNQLGRATPHSRAGC